MKVPMVEASKSAPRYTASSSKQEVWFGHSSDLPCSTSSPDKVLILAYTTDTITSELTIYKANAKAVALPTERTNRFVVQKGHREAS